MPTLRNLVSRRAFWFVAAGVVLVIVAVIAFAVHSNRGGQPTGKAAATEYVKAVNDRDVNAMAKLLPSGSKAEARKLMASSAKTPLVISNIDVREDFTDEASASLHGTAAGQPVQFYLSLGRFHGRWYVGKNSVPTTDTSKP